MSEEEIELNKLNLNFLLKNDASATKFNNKNSRVDGVIVSAGTSHFYEQKNREHQVHIYDSVLIEHDKFLSLKAAAKLSASASFYINVFDNVILIWDMSQYFTMYNEPFFFEKKMQKSNTNKEKVDKMNALLKYEDADFIISKKNWSRVSIHQLNEYIEIRKNEDKNQG